MGVRLSDDRRQMERQVDGQGLILYVLALMFAIYTLLLTQWLSRLDNTVEKQGRTIAVLVDDVARQGDTIESATAFCEKMRWCDATTTTTTTDGQVAP